MAVRNPTTFTDLSHELLCHIIQFLPLKEVLSMSMLCKKLLSSVSMHLRLRKCVDFCEGKIYDYMPTSITDDHMHYLFQKCPNLETVLGLHPLTVERRRLRKRSALTVPGIIEALSLCCNLKSIETSDLRLFEAIMQHLPKIEIIGHFRNRDGIFPPHASQRLKLQPYPRISSLHLIGVEVPELTAMPRLEHLYLQCVRFTKLQPFRGFLAQNLKTFVMKHCMGPTLSLRYLSLILALSSSPSLSRLELVRVPLPGGLFQRAVEDSYRHNGFVNLKTLVISGCKGVMEADLGHLMIVASKNLEKVYIQPSLTRDSLFVSLSFAQCEFPKLQSIHLGFVDKLNFSGEYSNDVLLSLGLAEVPDTPSSLTDSGMKVISQLFPFIKCMSVSNCPHLMAMDHWSVIDADQPWRYLTDLTLQKCHCLQLASFALFIAFLPSIEVLILNDMFREPPKGCSHVGLSAGTGLGMSSAVVSNQDEHIAVQGHQQDYEAGPVEDHLDNEEMERDFIDVDNEENPDQHIMVLQQEFFDEEARIVRPAVRPRDHANDPENRIRHEIDDDYNVALNIEIGQESENDDSYPIEQSKKKCSTLSSDEDDSIVDIMVFSEDEVEQKVEKEQSEPRSKKNDVKCQHSKECKNKCSKGFDPNQPSTSKGGNCLDCSCDSEDDPEEVSRSLVSKRGSIEKKSLKTEDKQQAKSEKAESPTKPCSSKGSLRTVKSEKNDDGNDAFKGPMTRGRKRVLNTDQGSEHPDSSGVPEKKYSSTGDKNPKKSKLDSDHDPALPSTSASHAVKDVKSSDKNNTSDDDDSLPDKKKLKKHRHKYKKCHKKDCEKPSHRRYPFTRSRRNRLPRDGFNIVSQGTQATSADIRRCLRKQRSCSLRCKRHSSCSSHRRSRNHISARQQQKRPSQQKQTSELHNKSTSTSDPLMEDDAVQVLRLVSETLVSLTIVSCGLSDIIIDHCQCLTHIEVQACRILKMFQLHYCPPLKRFNISQCPKLPLDVIIPETISLIATRKLLVSYEPCMQAYYPADTEREIFSKVPFEQSVILFHDYTGSANESLQAAAKESLLLWMEIVQKLYYSPSFWNMKQRRKKSKSQVKSKYPYGHFLRRIHGVFTLPPSVDPECKKWRYQILTNDHIFASALENVSWESGFPAPESSYIYAEEDVLVSMIEAQFTDLNLRLKKKMIAFYIPVTDSGVLMK